MPPIHYSQVTVIPSWHLDPLGVLTDAVPVFNGTVFANQYPVAGFNNGTSLGRVSEVNVTGSGGFASISGKRLTINVDKGVNVRSTYPSIGAYQSVSNIDLGAGLNTSIGSGTVTISVTAATPQINLTNNNAGVGIIQSPGTNSAFVLKSLVGAGGTTVQDMGSYIQINSTSSGGSITLGNTGTGAGIVVSSGTGSVFSLKGLVGVNGISVQDFGNYLQINGAGVGGSYTHPSYTPYLFTPTLVGTTLTVAGFSRDSIGSVDTITPYAFVLPSGGGGIAGISLNGVGTYTNVVFGSGFSVSGNTVTNIGAGHTLGNGALGAGIISVPGFSASHTLKGLLGGGNTTVTDMGSHILISSTGGGSSSNTIEVRHENITVNPAAFIVNFKGAGVTSVTNGTGVEVTIAGGGGGITGIAINGGGNFTNVTFTGAGVSVAGNIVTISGGGGGGLTGTSGNGLIVGTDSVSLNLATVSSAGALRQLTGVTSDYLAGDGIFRALPTGGGGAVTSVVTGMGSVLSVTPSVGNVVITPLGATTSFTPAFNTSNYTLTLPNTTHQGGILSSQGSTPLDLSLLRGITLYTQAIPGNPGESVMGDMKFLHLRAGTGVTLNTTFPTGNTADVTINAATGLPSGSFNQTMRHNGTTWEATDNLAILSSGIYSRKPLTIDPSTSATGITLDGNGTFNTIQCPRPLFLDATALRFGTASAMAGFFGATAIAQPVIIAGNQASIEAALIGLGLARY